MSDASLVVMLGGMAGGSLERLMRRALEASALDTAEAAIASGRFARALLLADQQPEFDVPAGLIVEVDDGSEPFQYGRRLAQAIAAHKIERLVYIGAGSGPLLRAEEFAALVDGVAGDAECCVTNNFFSSDFFALTPATLIGELDPSPQADNSVPRRLREEQDVEVTELPRTTETQFNIDVPMDLLVLALSGRGGPRLVALLAEWAPDTTRIANAARHFADREAEVLVAGRVNSLMWQYLERETACRVRVLAEERGMTATGRDKDGSARSILGQLIGAVGPERFFSDLLPELCTAAFIDIRPALVHLGLHDERGDRFATDAGQLDAIEDPRLRAIVAAARASKVPVVLGGHTLVASALMLLNDWAWADHDRALGIA